MTAEVIDDDGLLALVRSRSGDPEARVKYMAHPTHPNEPITPGAGWVCYAGDALPAAGIGATARDALLMALDAFPNEATITTQAEADRLIPELLRAEGERVLRIAPSEAIDLKYWLGWHEFRHVGPCGCPEACDPWSRCDACEVNGWEPPQARGLQRVIVEGGAAPMHPGWVRKIRDDCEAAGVEFRFLSWGSWAPGEEVEAAGNEWMTMYEHTDDGGAERHYWPDSPDRKMAADRGRTIERSVQLASDTFVLFVGREHSGRMLGGRTHDGDEDDDSDLDW